MRKGKWMNLSIVLVFLFSLFSPFASSKTFAAAGLQLLDVTDKKESTVLVWEVVNKQDEELTNYQLIKNGEVVDIEQAALHESAENNVKRYSYEDQDVEMNTVYTYEIAAYLSTGEKVVSAPVKHTFVGQAEEIQAKLTDTSVGQAEEIQAKLTDTSVGLAEEIQVKLADTSVGKTEEIEVKLADISEADVVTNIKVMTDQGNIPWIFDFTVDGVSEKGTKVSYFGDLDDEGYFVDYDTESRNIELPIGTYTLSTDNYSTGEVIRAEFTIESGIDYVTNPIDVVLPDEQLIIKKVLKIEGKTEQSISIWWDEPVDFQEGDKYLVYLDDELVEEITDQFNTFYTYSGLSPETLYQVRVDYIYKDGATETLTADVTTSASPTGEIVAFADENLKNAIKEQLKITHRDIYTDDMENLTSLDAGYSDIRNLTGLESAINLDDLLLYGNQIEDLSPIANLTNLVSLDLDENLITSLEDLINLKNLETLLLSFNQIKDIRVLDELPKLSYVTLYRNESLDFSKGSENAEVLKSLLAAGVTVEWLLEDNEILIQDVTESSVAIEISFPRVTDFVSTYNLYLNGELAAEIPVGKNEYLLTDLEPLTEYEISIDAIDKDGIIWGSAYSYVKTPSIPEGELVQFKDEALEKAVHDALHIHSRDLYESDMKVLTSLDSSNRGIKALDGLEYAVNLEELLLDLNEVSNLEPIAGLTNLVHLSLSKNKLSDISGLASLTNLVSLVLDHNEITDIRSLSQLSNLSLLSFQGNNVNDIQALSGLNIEYLNIGYNEIEDISSLLALENLQFVLVMKNPLDLTEGSDDQSVVQTLQDNGVMVSYEYLDISAHNVTKDSVEIRWLPVPEDGNVDYTYYLVVDGKEITSEIQDSSYILTDLQADTEYMIEVFGMSADFERFIYGTTVIKTAGDEKNPGEGTEKPGDGAVGEEGKAPTDQKTNPVTDDQAQVQTPNGNQNSGGSNLPNTASNMYNNVLIGFVLLAFGVLWLRRRKQNS
ncbi:fibronectin type III domain-containing protein [Neobacillus vireti]|uniref:fibronectin type III domain-containing protein n=1 Tax=Neobacillus vireti TaxID=220686 RepID=UPI002FFF7621